MPDELFKVVVYDPEGFWHYVMLDLPAKAAVEAAKELVDLTATPFGADTQRILITDRDDNTCFLWERGKGVVFPPREEVT